MVETRYLLEFKDKEANEVLSLVFYDKSEAYETTRFLKKLDKISNIRLLEERSLRVGSKVYVTTENKVI